MNLFVRPAAGSSFDMHRRGSPQWVQQCVQHLVNRMFSSFGSACLTPFLTPFWSLFRDSIKLPSATAGYMNLSGTNSLFFSPFLWFHPLFRRRCKPTEVPFLAVSTRHGSGCYLLCIEYQFVYNDLDWYLLYTEWYSLCVHATSRILQHWFQTAASDSVSYRDRRHYDHSHWDIC